MPSPAQVGTADVGNFMLRRPSVFPRRHLEDSSPRRLLLSGSPALKIPVPNSLLGGNPVRQSQQLARAKCPDPTPLLSNWRGGEHLPNLRWGVEILQRGRVDSRRVRRATAQFQASRFAPVGVLEVRRKSHIELLACRHSARPVQPRKSKSRSLR